MNHAALIAALLFSRDWSGYAADPVVKEVVREVPVVQYVEKPEQPWINWQLTELPERVEAEKPLWLFFTATWCQPCQTAKADYLAWMKKSGWKEGVHFRFVDIDAEPSTAKMFDIESVPTFVLVRGETELKRYTSYPGRDALPRDWLAALPVSAPKGPSKFGGTLKRSQVNSIVLALRSLDGNLTARDEIKLPLSQMNAVIPKGCKLSWRPDGTRIDLSKPYPFIKWGAVSQELSGVAIGEKRVTLELPWMFDITLEIEDDPEPVSATPRSPKWPAVRAEYLKTHPECAACGTRNELNVHHVVPFHLDESKELDPENLITLCREHHLTVGHDPDFDGPMKPNWSAENKNVRRDAERMRKKLKP